MSSNQQILKFVFLDNSHIFLPVSYLTDLTSEPWFLKNLIEDIPQDGTHVDEFPIYETRENVISIIETLRAGTLCLQPGVSLPYFKFLANKWCLPHWVEEQTEQKMSNATPYTKETEKEFLVNNVTLSCSICMGAYKLGENTPTSCLSHKGEWNEDTKTWSCCRGTSPCYQGYHTSHVSLYSNLKKLFSM